MLGLKSRYILYVLSRCGRINDLHSRESSRPAVRMKGLVRAKEAIVRQIGNSRSTMRDSHAKVSETCPFSTDFLAADVSRTPLTTFEFSFFCETCIFYYYHTEKKSVKTCVSPLEFCCLCA